MLAEALSRLVNLSLMEPYPPKIEGHEYGYAIFEPLAYISISNVWYNLKLKLCDHYTL